MKSILRTGLLVVAIMLAIAVPADAGPFEDGAESAERGDYATALRIFRSLAEQGLAEAQINLGRMYRFGHGVPQDLAAAHMWLTLAAAQGDENAQIARDSLAKLMTHGQIEEATLLVREWRAEHQR